MAVKDILDIVFVFSLFGKAIGDIFACVFLQPYSETQEVAYNGFSMQTVPIYQYANGASHNVVYGLSTLFIFHAIFRPPVMLTIEQNIGGEIVSGFLLLNLLVGYGFGGAYIAKGIRQFS